MTSTFECHKCRHSGHWPSSCQYNRPSVKLQAQKNKRARHNTIDLTGDDAVEVKIEPATTRKGIYVIQHGFNQIYVGRSLDIDASIIQHQNYSDGARFIQNWDTAKEVGVLTEPIHCDLESWERNETLLRMSQVGIDNVRGWMFQNRVLTTPERTEAFNQICEKFDTCRRCGRTDHHTYRCTYLGSFAAWMGPA